MLSSHAFWVWVYLNSPTIQAVCAVLALIGLIFYVFYTWRMTQAALETRRLQLTPCLVPRFLEPREGNGFEVVNVSAPAVNLVIWHYTPGSELKLTGVKFICPPHEDQDRRASLIMGNNPLILRIPAYDTRRLYVIECRDTAAEVYQLQILIKPIADATFAADIQWIKPPDSLTPYWRRLSFWWKHRKDPRM